MGFTNDIEGLLYAPIANTTGEVVLVIFPRSFQSAKDTRGLERSVLHPDIELLNIVDRTFPLSLVV